MKIEIWKGKLTCFFAPLFQSRIETLYACADIAKHLDLSSVETAIDCAHWTSTPIFFSSLSCLYFVFVMLAASTMAARIGALSRISRAWDYSSKDLRASAEEFLSIDGLFREHSPSHSEEISFVNFFKMCSLTSFFSHKALTAYEYSPNTICFIAFWSTSSLGNLLTTPEV